MKYKLILFFICFYYSLSGQSSNFQLNSKIGISNNIFNNVRLTSLEFRPSSYADLSFSSKILKHKKLYLSLGSGITYSSTQLFQARIILGQEYTDRIEEEVGLLYGNFNIGAGIQAFKKFYVEFNVKPSIVLFKGDVFSGRYGSLFVLKNYNLFSELEIYYKISDLFNVGLGYSLGLLDVYKQKYTNVINSEGGADIFLQSYFIGFQYNL